MHQQLQQELVSSKNIRVSSLISVMDVLFNTNWVYHDSNHRHFTIIIHYPLSSLFISMKSGSLMVWSWLDSAFRMASWDSPTLLNRTGLLKAVRVNPTLGDDLGRIMIMLWPQVKMSQLSILLGHVSKVLAEFLEQVQDSVQVPCMNTMNQSSISTRSPSFF